MFVDTLIRGFPNKWKFILLKRMNIFHWNLRFVDCPYHEIHEIKHTTNKKDFTVV